MIVRHLGNFISSFIMMSSIVYIWHKLINEKINFKSKKLYIILICMSIVSVINFYIVDKYIKILSITSFLIICFIILFKKKLNVSILTPIFTQLIFMISETIFILFITIIFNPEVLMLLGEFVVNFILNIVITLFAIILIQFKFIHKIYNKILGLLHKVKNVQFLFLSIVIIIALSIFPITIYYKIRIQYLIIFYSTMIILCGIIVINSLKTENKYNKVNDKYNIAVNSLKEYENMMTKYRIANHENKNLLLTVRAMIINKEKNIPEYIDSLVENKYNDDEKLLLDMSVLPAGGIRATIYSEILKLKEHKIDYNLNIDKNLRTVDLIEFDTKTTIEICKIICVFIDNAIEEVIKMKNKNINIDIYLNEGFLEIKVSNLYKNKIEIDKIFDEGYTTKGEGHGYGLSLVKSIVNKNNNFINRTEIKNRLFCQTIAIKCNR